jgi:hypothetical protein
LRYLCLTLARVLLRKDNALECDLGSLLN